MLDLIVFLMGGTLVSVLWIEIITLFLEGTRIGNVIQDKICEKIRNN